MEFRILGPLEALEDGQQLDLGGAKQRALLAILLLHANETVSTDRLIDALWDEQPPETAQKALQVHVSRLRKALGKERLETKPPGYRLRLADGELDLQRFQRLAETEPREALTLWRGPPLAEFAYQQFAQAEIPRLEELRLACLEGRIEGDLRQGKHAALVSELERLIGEHPLRERLRAQLMLALYRSGRQAEALEAYQDARQTLTEELGIEPSAELRELQQAILRQETALDLAVTAKPAGEVEAARGIFVGREAELAELEAGLRDALAGRGSLFLLVGEPGIGKSRLSEELIAGARERGACVLVGRCWEAGGAPAYWPWIQSLRMYLEQTEAEALRTDLGAGAADLAQILPELRNLLPDLPRPSLEGEGARFRLFDSVARFLRSGAAARPLLIVLDDLHAADEPSLLMLRFVAGELSRSRILVLGTYRDVGPTVRDPLASTLAELAREQVTHRIELGGFGSADVERYMELTAGATPAPELVAAIHAETEGNPLFVGEMVRLLAAEGRLAELDAQALQAAGVPQGVREVIGRRLGRLSEESQRVLTLASVLGREFELEALARLSELSGDELLAILDEAVTERLLAAVPGAPARLRFGHALIRETLYDQLTAPRRVQLHKQAGEALEDLYVQDPEPNLAELAHHFFEAAPGGDLDKALGYSKRAGARAVAVSAYEEGARFYERALQVLELKPPTGADERGELLLELGDALSKAGSMLEAKDVFLAAADLARSSGSSERLARAALGYGGRNRFARAGSDRRLVPLLEEALDAQRREETVLKVRLMARLAAALRDEPSLERRSALSSEAVDIARRLGDKTALADALVSHFTATWSPDAERLLPIAQEAGRLANEVGDAERAFQARFLDHVASLTVGELAEPERVAAIMEEHRAIADVLKQPALQWWSMAMRAIGALLVGEFSEAERLAEEAFELGRRAQSWDAGFSYRMALFILRREQGRLEEIDDLIRESIEEYAGYRSFRCLVPLIDCELGRPDATARRFDELAADEFSALPRDAEWLFCLSVLAEVAAHLRDEERADVLYRLLLPYEELNALASGEVSVGCVARYLGILAATTGSWDQAARHFETAVKLNARMGARPWVAHTQEDYARMLRARGETGDAEKAERLLETALSTYRELGMTGALERARAFAGV